METDQISSKKLKPRDPFSGVSTVESLTGNTFSSMDFYGTLIEISHTQTQRQWLDPSPAKKNESAMLECPKLGEHLDFQYTMFSIHTSQK